MYIRLKLMFLHFRFNLDVPHANHMISSFLFCDWIVGTPLHHAAKERNRKAMRFLLENGAFLAPDMTDSRFNPPLHYCPGLQWVYKVRDKIMGGAQETKSDPGSSSSDP